MRSYQIDEVILDQITDKMPNGHLETEVKIEIELEITIMTIREEMNLDPDLILE